MATYLITGAAGFIASRVAEFLLDAGHQVIGLDNLNDAYDVRMKYWRLEKLKQKNNFSFYQVDIGLREAMQQWSDAHPREISSLAAVINLAARAGVRQSVENPWVYMDTNLNGTLNLLELCRQSGVDKFVLASTSSIYGQNAPLPTPETADSNYPLQPYAASKKAAEVLSYSYHYLYGVDVTVFRYFTVYGPAGRPDMSMFRFTQWIREGHPVKLNGSGEQTRGFTYVDDIARGTILGLKQVGYEIVNLGGHEEISMNALIHKLEILIDRPAQVEHRPFHPADMLANRADIRKARQLLGWEPQVSLQDGITQMVAWYDAEREWASQLITE